MTEPQGTSLIPINDETRAIAAFKTKDGLEPLLSAIEAECRAQPQVLTTENGRKNIASLAYKIAQAKVRLDEIGMALNEPHQKEIDLVNAGRKVAKARMQALQDEIRAPLTKWEQDEKIRIAAHEEKLKWFESLIIWGPEMPKPVTSAMIQARIDLVNEDARDWQEYSTRAERIKTEVLTALRADLEATKAAEIEAAEAEKWLAMYDAAVQENREFDLKRAAAKAARELAESQAAVELVWAEAHRENAEFDRQRAEKLRIEAEERADNEKWQRIFAEADAENMAFDAKIEAAAEAARAAAQATKDEAARQQKIKDDEAAETAAREADQKHRGKITGEAVDAISDILSNLTGSASEDPQDWAFEIVQAITRGEVPHVTIKF